MIWQYARNRYKQNNRVVYYALVLREFDCLRRVVAETHPQDVNAPPAAVKTRQQAETRSVPEWAQCFAVAAYS